MAAVVPSHSVVVVPMVPSSVRGYVKSSERFDCTNVQIDFGGGVGFVFGLLFLLLDSVFFFFVMVVVRGNRTCVC